MITIIIIIAYILNVFLNRYLNKLLVKKCYHGVKVSLWFIPILSTVVLIIIIIDELPIVKLNNKIINWFIGKNW